MAFLWYNDPAEDRCNKHAQPNLPKIGSSDQDRGEYVLGSYDHRLDQNLVLILQVQKGKDEVMLEFPADDAAGGDHEDALFEMSFHIPKENDRFGTGDESTSAAEVSTACSFLSVSRSKWVYSTPEMLETRQG